MYIIWLVCFCLQPPVVESSVVQMSCSCFLHQNISPHLSVTMAYTWSEEPKGDRNLTGIEKMKDTQDINKVI